MAENDPTHWSVAELGAAYRERSLSPVEVTTAFLDRIEHFDGELHAFVKVTRDLALDQAGEGERRFKDGDGGHPLLGIPISIKDAFHLRGHVTTLGSMVHRDAVSKVDSGVVRRLRATGAVFTGKTNTAEFGQSATTDNLLGPDTANPWDVTRTPGGSSGGAAASVAAGLSTMAIGSDGGGSIRIPAAFTGLYGLKPGAGVVPDEKGFRAMTDFVSAGPLTNSVADARIMLGVLADTTYERNQPPVGLRIGYCAKPEGRPVDAAVTASVAEAARHLAGLGHHVIEVDLPIHDWSEVFGPLVLEDEHRERGHLLEHTPELLTRYERSTLRAALGLDPTAPDRAREQLRHFRAKIDNLFATYDVLLTPSVAVPAFPLGQRPESIDGEPVDQLWGAFPFGAPFNVAGVPAASVPCGLAEGLPVGAQLVTRAGAEGLLLDVSEQLEEAVAFGRSSLHSRWSLDPEGAT